ncbi:Uncharacterized protein dnm_054400 [Desulfonema magnum]|uniref:Uncharacterized protein n=1 Tax=Desulfonema magnum TaxID=45655 RepID=A0A975BPB6_9BACT|nr:Uncharacterized protein dnm_054400 [Desulfonema magnum]
MYDFNLAGHDFRSFSYLSIKETRKSALSDRCDLKWSTPDNILLCKNYANIYNLLIF